MLRAKVLYPTPSNTHTQSTATVAQHLTIGRHPVITNCIMLIPNNMCQDTPTMVAESEPCNGWLAAMKGQRGQAQEEGIAGGAT